jgi:hypothetical protein
VKQAINSIRERRIQRILGAPTNRILDLPWVKRALCIVMVAGSYLVFATFFFPYSNEDLRLIKLMASASGIPWWMIAAFFLLRSSTRRITSLPDEYLDERELELRDWAFRMGYLVVRRIGLALSALTVLGYLVFYVLYLFTAASSFYSSATEVRPWWGYAFENLNDYIKDVIGPMPLFTLSTLIILLTYVAYSFPQILLAWRDAREQKAAATPERIEVDLKALSDHYALTSKRYFKLLIAAVISLPAAFGAVALLFSVPLMGMLGAFGFLFAPGVYLWAEIKLISIVYTLRKSDLAKVRRQQLATLTILGAMAGVAIPVLFVVATYSADKTGMPIWIAMFSGLAAVGFHSAAYATLRLTSLELVSGETTSS